MPTVKYVAGLDGLRAVAVIAVLLFHAEFSFAPGGFLGVSLFFTLSGFLITSLLIDEWESTGALSFRRFYGRRVRRLLPAAYLCLLLIAVLSPWWVATQLRSLPGDLLAAVANVANSDILSKIDPAAASTPSCDCRKERAFPTFAEAESVRRIAAESFKETAKPAASS